MSYFHGLDVKSSRGSLRRLLDITRLAVHYQRLHTWVYTHAIHRYLVLITRSHSWLYTIFILSTRLRTRVPFLVSDINVITTLYSLR